MAIEESFNLCPQIPHYRFVAYSDAALAPEEAILSFSFIRWPFSNSFGLAEKSLSALGVVRDTSCFSHIQLRLANTSAHP